MKDGLTLIAVVLDRSGSMSACQSDMEGGINTFIKEQAAEPGECRLFFSQFDDFYEVVADFIDIKEAPFYPLVPRGMTALHDAVGKTVTDVGAHLAATPEEERPSKVIVVIVTDGGENSSVGWKADAVRELVERQTNEYNWTFTYLGANQDSVMVGQSIGVIAGATMDYATSNAGISNAYASLSNTTSAVRNGTLVNFSYTDEDRENATAQ